MALTRSVIAKFLGRHEGAQYETFTKILFENGVVDRFAVEFWVKITILILQTCKSENIIVSIVYNINRCFESNLYDLALLLTLKLTETALISQEYEDAFLEMIVSDPQFATSKTGFLTVLAIL